MSRRQREDPPATAGGSDKSALPDGRATAPLADCSVLSALLRLAFTFTFAARITLRCGRRSLLAFLF